MPKCRLFSCQTQTNTPGRCLWTPHGTTLAATRRRRPRRSPTCPPQWSRPPRGRTAGCTRGARTCGRAGSPPTSSTLRSRASSPGSSGRSRTWRPRQAPPPHTATASMARGATRGRSMRSPVGPRAILDTRNSSAEASECATQRANIRLAVVRRTRHANGGCGARSGYSIEEASPGMPGPASLCPLINLSTYQNVPSVSRLHDNCFDIGCLRVALSEI